MVTSQYMPVRAIYLSGGYMEILGLFKSDRIDPDEQLKKLDFYHSRIERDMDRYQVEITRSKEAMSKIDKELGDILSMIEIYRNSQDGTYDDHDAKQLLSQMVMLQEEQADVRLELADARSNHNELRPLERTVKNKIYSMERAIYDAKSFGKPVNSETIDGIIKTIQDTDKVLGQRTPVDSYQIRRFKERQRNVHKDVLDTELARLKGVIDIDRVLSDIKDNPGNYNPSIVKAYEIIETPATEIPVNTI